MDVGRFPQDPVPNVVHLRATEPPSPDVVEIAERAIRIAVGVASLSVGSSSTRSPRRSAARP